MNRDRSGFTLIELLIAVSIFAIISVSLYSALRGGINLWHRQEKAITLNESARYLLDNIARELRNAVKYPQPKAEPGPETKEQTDLKFDGQQKQLQFLTLQGLMEENRRYKGMVKISYSFETSGEDGEGVVKKSWVSQKEDFKDESRQEQILLKDIADLRFEYAAWDQESAVYDWKPGWQAAGPPRGVRITIILGTSASGGKRSMLKKLVFIPAGSQEEEEGQGG